jgi:hypothetical protein
VTWLDSGHDLILANDRCVPNGFGILTSSERSNFSPVRCRVTHVTEKLNFLILPDALETIVSLRSQTKILGRAATLQ